MTRVTTAQRKVLEVIAEGGSFGESWAQNGDDDRLAWYRHERTLDAVKRKGLIEIDAAGDVALTPAGRALVTGSDPRGGP